MSKHGIETMDDLLADRAQLENSRDKLIDERRLRTTLLQMKQKPKESPLIKLQGQMVKQ